MPGAVREVVQVVYVTRTKRVPEDEGEIVVLFPLLAELEECTLPCIRVHQVDDKCIDFVLFLDAKNVVLLMRLETERGCLGEAREALLLVRIELSGVLKIGKRLWRDEPRHGGTMSTLTCLTNCHNVT